MGAVELNAFNIVCQECELQQQGYELCSANNGVLRVALKSSSFKYFCLK